MSLFPAANALSRASDFLLRVPLAICRKYGSSEVRGARGSLARNAVCAAESGELLSFSLPKSGQQAIDSVEGSRRTVRASASSQTAQDGTNAIMASRANGELREERKESADASERGGRRWTTTTSATKKGCDFSCFLFVVVVSRFFLFFFFQPRPPCTFPTPSMMYLSLLFFVPFYNVQTS